MLSANIATATSTTVSPEGGANTSSACCGGNTTSGVSCDNSNSSCYSDSAQADSGAVNGYEATLTVPTAGIVAVAVMHALPGGLRGDYFVTPDMLHARAVLSRVDGGGVNFVWGSGAPAFTYVVVPDSASHDDYGCSDVGDDSTASADDDSDVDDDDASGSYSGGNRSRSSGMDGHNCASVSLNAGRFGPGDFDTGLDWRWAGSGSAAASATRGGGTDSNDGYDAYYYSSSSGGASNSRYTSGTSSTYRFSGSSDDNDIALIRRAIATQSSVPNDSAASGSPPPVRPFRPSAGAGAARPGSTPLQYRSHTGTFSVRWSGALRVTADSGSFWSTSPGGVREGACDGSLLSPSGAAVDCNMNTTSDASANCTPVAGAYNCSSGNASSSSSCNSGGGGDGDVFDGSGWYDFFVHAAGGVRLFIDGALLIDASCDDSYNDICSRECGSHRCPRSSSGARSTTSDCFDAPSTSSTAAHAAGNGDASYAHQHGDAWVGDGSDDFAIDPSTLHLPGFVDSDAYTAQQSVMRHYLFDSGGDDATPWYRWSSLRNISGDGSPQSAHFPTTVSDGPGTGTLCAFVRRGASSPSHSSSADGAGRSSYPGGGDGVSIPDTDLLCVCASHTGAVREFGALERTTSAFSRVTGANGLRGSILSVPPEKAIYAAYAWDATVGMVTAHNDAMVFGELHDNYTANYDNDDATTFGALRDNATSSSTDCCGGQQHVDVERTARCCSPRSSSSSSRCGATGIQRLSTRVWLRGGNLHTITLEYTRGGGNDHTHGINTDRQPPMFAFASCRLLWITPRMRAAAAAAAAAGGGGAGPNFNFSGGDAGPNATLAPVPVPPFVLYSLRHVSGSPSVGYVNPAEAVATGVPVQLPANGTLAAATASSSAGAVSYAFESMMWGGVASIVSSAAADAAGGVYTQASADDGDNATRAAHTYDPDASALRLLSEVGTTVSFPYARTDSTAPRAYELYTGSSIIQQIRDAPSPVLFYVHADADADPDMPLGDGAAATAAGDSPYSPPRRRDGDRDRTRTPDRRSYGTYASCARFARPLRPNSFYIEPRDFFGNERGILAEADAQLFVVAGVPLALDREWPLSVSRTGTIAGSNANSTRVSCPAVVVVGSAADSSSSNNSDDDLTARVAAHASNALGVVIGSVAYDRTTGCLVAEWSPKISGVYALSVMMYNSAAHAPTVAAGSNATQQQQQQRVFGTGLIRHVRGSPFIVRVLPFAPLPLLPPHTESRTAAADSATAASADSGGVRERLRRGQPGDYYSFTTAPPDAAEPRVTMLERGERGSDDGFGDEGAGTYPHHRSSSSSSSQQGRTHSAPFPSTSSSFVSGSGLEAAGVNNNAGAPFVVVVVPRDEYGNPWVYLPAASQEQRRRRRQRSSACTVNTSSYCCSGCSSGSGGDDVGPSGPPAAAAAAAAALAASGRIQSVDASRAAEWGGAWLSVLVRHTTQSAISVPVTVTAFSIEHEGYTAQRCGARLFNYSGSDSAPTNIQFNFCCSGGCGGGCGGDGTPDNSTQPNYPAVPAAAASVVLPTGVLLNFSLPACDVVTAAAANSSDCVSANYSSDDGEDGGAAVMRACLESTWWATVQATTCTMSCDSTPSIDLSPHLRQLVFVAVYTPIVSGQYSVYVDYTDHTAATAAAAAPRYRDSSSWTRGAAYVSSSSSMRPAAPMLGSPYPVYVAPGRTDGASSTFALLQQQEQRGTQQQQHSSAHSTAAGQSQPLFPSDGAIGILTLRDAYGNARAWGCATAAATGSGGYYSPGSDSAGALPLSCENGTWVPPASDAVDSGDMYNNTAAPLSSATAAAAAVAAVLANVTVVIESTILPAWGGVVILSVLGNVSLRAIGGNGSEYAVSLPCIGSLCAVTVGVNGEGVIGSPSVYARSARDASGAQSNAWGPGLVTATAGERAWFIVQLRDGDGNVLRGSGVTDALINGTWTRRTEFNVSAVPGPRLAGSSVVRLGGVRPSAVEGGADWLVKQQQQQQRQRHSGSMIAPAPPVRSMTVARMLESAEMLYRLCACTTGNARRRMAVNGSSSASGTHSHPFVAAASCSSGTALPRQCDHGSLYTPTEDRSDSHSYTSNLPYSPALRGETWSTVWGCTLTSPTAATWNSGASGVTLPTLDLVSPRFNSSDSVPSGWWLTEDDEAGGAADDDDGISAVLLPNGTLVYTAAAATTSTRSFVFPIECAALQQQNSTVDTAAAAAGLLNCSYTVFRSGLYAVSVMIDGVLLASGPTIVPALPTSADASTSVVRIPATSNNNTGGSASGKSLGPHGVRDIVFQVRRAAVDGWWCSGSVDNSSATGGAPAPANNSAIAAVAAVSVDVVLRDSWGNRIGRTGIDSALIFMRLRAKNPTSPARDGFNLTSRAHTYHDARASAAEAATAAASAATAANADGAASTSTITPLSTYFPVEGVVRTDLGPLGVPAGTYALDVSLASSGSGVDVDVYALPECERGSLLSSSTSDRLEHVCVIGAMHGADVATATAAGQNVNNNSSSSAQERAVATTLCPPELLSVLTTRAATSCVRKYGFIRPVFGLSDDDTPAISPAFTSPAAVPLAAAAATQQRHGHFASQIANATGSGSSSSAPLVERTTFTVETNGRVRLLLHTQGLPALFHENTAALRCDAMRLRGGGAQGPSPSQATDAYFFDDDAGERGFACDSSTGGEAVTPPPRQAWRVLIDSATHISGSSSSSGSSGTRDGQTATATAHTVLSSSSTTVMSTTVELVSGSFYGFLLQYTPTAAAGAVSARPCSSKAGGCYLRVTMRSPSLNSTLASSRVGSSGSISTRQRYFSASRWDGASAASDAAAADGILVPPMFLFSASAGASVVDASPYTVHALPGDACAACTAVFVRAEDVADSSAAAGAHGAQYSSSTSSTSDSSSNAEAVVDASGAAPGTRQLRIGSNSVQASASAWVDVYPPTSTDELNTQQQQQQRRGFTTLRLLSGGTAVLYISPYDAFGNDRSLGDSAASDVLLPFAIRSASSSPTGTRLVLPPAAFNVTYVGAGSFALTFAVDVVAPITGAQSGVADAGIDAGAAPLLLFLCVNPRASVVQAAAGRGGAALLDAATASGCLVSSTPISILSVPGI